MQGLALHMNFTLCRTTLESGRYALVARANNIRRHAEITPWDTSLLDRGMMRKHCSQEVCLKYFPFKEHPPCLHATVRQTTTNRGLRHACTDSRVAAVAMAMAWQIVTSGMTGVRETTCGCACWRRYSTI